MSEGEPSQNGDNSKAAFGRHFGLWLGVILITPFLITGMARGKSNGSEIGKSVAIGGIGALLITSILAARALRFDRNSGYAGAAILFFVLGLIVGLGVFSMACSSELGRALGH